MVAPSGESILPTPSKIENGIRLSDIPQCHVHSSSESNGISDKETKIFFAFSR